ncbi:radical SAM protein with 4Fe4S-binding SPASM domain [Caldicellulosiruptor bescii]|uniref:Radical SAM domain protein n=2 Tax=Caldicellulosiruptor bescii TaxID=31899 RepID=B9MQR4_CALBD|nr:radical SAM protein [Caldicellulosiruptor bescii]ACM60018.1 Radical SAM domain protein [Caldicellulosiruptor bescii DSM 6725]PBC87438.1 radical SAM protein with 4Fe4S-binding SPASM domain [Caldicellulosiruptor bescii]PBC90371.1 radical SAM protein with 4Fe4S-binding SPASM domain [Caldicellulosiruptor bescii]PBD04197.1 radical SAM protein with 4Fe4S-binding SPASM domain [Caldicellulosiruptor bescii]PBD06168.1 radical SAM protein with 4Fe4S-binding SPASM domain [Caldicellulosiruptor bescii]
MFVNSEDIFSSIPILSASVKVTRKCNLACKHCYVANKNFDYQSELSVNEIKLIIEQLYEAGCLDLYLNGGEPFLNENILEICEFAHNKGLRISVSTNGITIDEEIIKILSKFNLKIFQVSIDGLEETHDKIRNKIGAFREGIKALNLAKRYFKNSDTTVIMATTLMEDNKNQIFKLYDLACELNVDTYALIPLLPTGRACSAIDVSVKEKMDIFSNIAEYFVSKNTSTELSLILPPGLIPKVLSTRKYGKGYYCTFPNIIGIDSNGNIAPCDGLLNINELIIGNIRKKTIEECWYSFVMEEIRNINVNQLKGVCSMCKFLSTCRGGCRAYAYIKTGSFYASDPLCQEIYEAGLFPKESLKT